ncbi:MAG TPA: YtxH domain-containing protein [Microscillaceae bacterium]|nr:YtxH domain-containing protein [Microscillaceae bacterium]
MSNKSWLGFVAGIAVGATTAVLLAPDKGKNTRKRIKSKAKDWGVDLDKVEQRVDKGVDRVNDLAQSALDNIGSYSPRKARKKITA